MYTSHILSAIINMVLFCIESVGIVVIRAKITGIKDLFTAKTAEENGADFISFVFDMDSKDYVSPQRAAVMSCQTPYTRKVGIFTDDELARVNRVADEVGLDYVQLNGNETNEYIRQVNRPVIKRYYYDEHFFSVKAAEDCPAKIILLDLGEQDYHNKRLAEEIAHIHKSVIVAGDIDRENVLKVNRILQPYAVDVSEGLNSYGEMSCRKIKSFLRRVDGIYYQGYKC